MNTIKHAPVAVALGGSGAVLVVNGLSVSPLFGADLVFQPASPSHQASDTHKDAHIHGPSDMSRRQQLEEAAEEQHRAQMQAQLSTGA